MGKKANYELVKHFVESIEGWSLVSKEYIGVHSKLELRCNNGHIFKMSYNCLRSGQRCPIEKGENIRKKKAHSIEYIISSINKVPEYTYVDGHYLNGKSLLTIKHIDHTYQVCWNNFQQGKRCPICSPKWSRAEKIIANYVKSIYSGIVIENDRTLIINPSTGNYLELDLFMPEINKAIEYNGLHWHSDQYAQYKDKVKQDYCDNNSIGLLVINDLQWNGDFSTIHRFIYQ